MKLCEFFKNSLIMQRKRQNILKLIVNTSLIFMVMKKVLLSGSKN